MSSSESLRIFRAALRVSRQIPSEVVRRKFRFNVREIVEFYTTYADQTKASDRLLQGWRVLKTFETVTKADLALTEKLLKPFDFMIPKEKKETGVSTENGANTGADALIQKQMH